MSRSFEDYSGNELNPTLTGSPTITGSTLAYAGTNLVYNAFDFNGTTQYITVPDDSSLDVTTDMTFCAWINPDVNNIDMMLITKYLPTGDQRSFQFAMNPSGQILIWLGKNGQSGPSNRNLLTGTSTIPTGEWSFVAVTYDQTNARLYINGVQDNSASFSDAVFSGSADVLIGAYDGGSFPFNGKMVMPAVFNRALSADELLDLYNQNLPKTYSQLPTSIVNDAVLALELTDNDDTSNDLSGYGNDGTKAAGVTTGATEIDFDASGTVETVNTALFDGSSQLLSIADNDDIDITNLTAGGLFYIDQSGGGAAKILMEKWDTGSNQRTFTIQYDNTADQIICSCSTNGSGSGSVTYNVTLNNEWAHIILTYDGTDMKIFLNGVEVASNNPISGNLYVGTANFTVGARDGGSLYHKGSVSNILVSGRAYVEEEITELFGLSISNQLFDNSQAIKDDYVIALPLNDGVASGREFEDFGGFDLDPVNTGSITLTGATLDVISSKRYLAYEFDGVDDYIDVANDSSWYLGAGSRTDSLWFKTSTKNTWMKHSQGSNITTDASDLYLDGNGHFVVRILESSNSINWTRRVATDYADGKWHHVAVDYDGYGAGKIYIDGELKTTADTTTGTVTDISPTSGLRLGRRIANDFEWNGDLANFMRFNRSLTANEASQLYNQNAVADFSALPTSITDDCILALSLSSKDRTLTDISTNTNNGTSSGAAIGTTEIDWNI